jgi:hypothetical protein
MRLIRAPSTPRRVEAVTLRAKAESFSATPRDTASQTSTGVEMPHARKHNLNFFDSAQCLMVRRWRLIGYFPDLNFFDSAQCLMVRRWRLIGHFPIL